jgi:hypothetical protein
LDATVVVERLVGTDDGVGLITAGAEVFGLPLADDVGRVVVGASVVRAVVVGAVAVGAVVVGAVAVGVVVVGIVVGPSATLLNVNSHPLGLSPR